MRVPRAGIALAAITVFVAGCGGGAAAPGTTTRGSEQVDPQQVAHLEAFAACMRAHGVAHMPAADGNGRPGVNGSGQVDLRSPTVKAAIKTCLPIADGLVGANVQPVGVIRTAPKQAPAARESATAPASGPLDCDSVTTCYTPQQIEVAYGIRPLLERGIDGRGETVVLPEVERLNSALKAAAARHVTVIAASGDTGAAGEPCQVIKGLAGGGFPPVKEVNLPAADPLVLATGGTSLDASHATGANISETAWGLPFGSPGTQFQASGGGFSRLFPRPEYQSGVPGIAATRGVPDVAADGSPHTGMALVISDGGNRYTIRNSGGTLLVRYSNQ